MIFSPIEVWERSYDDEKFHTNSNSNKKKINKTKTCNCMRKNLKNCMRNTVLIIRVVYENARKKNNK